jgi:RHS repeat-associated protein
VIYYHRDVVGSTAAITGAGGTLIEERTHYPFGAVRAVRRVGDPLGGADHDFTGKERDAESGLIAMGARSCLDLAGIFLSPDPKYAAVAGLAAGSPADEAAFAAFLANPQLGNLYAYAARNPLKFVDPSGLDVVFSKALKDSPVFQEALDLFKSTKEGQRLLARLEKSSAKVTVSAGRVFSQQPKTRGREVLGQATIEYNTRVTLNLHLHKKMFASKDLMILELADTIHHELRHAEGNVNTRDLAQARRILGALDDAAATMKLPRQPLDPRLRMGREVHKGLDTNLDDPYNSEFRRQAEAEQAKRNDEDHVEVIDD